MEEVGTTPQSTRCSERHNSPAPIDLPANESISIPASRSGIRSAIQALADRMHPWTPARHRPHNRPKLPRIEFASETHPNRPPPVDDRLTIVVPNDLLSLFVCSPLVLYLGARLVCQNVETPRILGPDGTAVYTFTSTAHHPNEVRTLLRRCFALDRILSDGEQYESVPTITEQHDVFGEPIETIRSALPADRLAAYVSVPAAEIDRFAPTWPLAMYVTPTLSSVKILPYALERLAVIARASSQPLNQRDQLSMALERTYRSNTHTGHLTTVVDSAETLAHGWCGDGVPVDTFGGSIADFTSVHQTGVPRVSNPTATVVVNGQTSDSTEVRRAISNRNSSLNRCSIYSDLTRRELLSLIEEEHDYFHFIGHCSDDRLQCADGFLSPNLIDKTGIKSFFINGCNSFPVGRQLLDAGALVGAITRNPVTDKQAATVGSRFIESLCAGYRFLEALCFARRQVYMVLDYAVVGDGMFRFTGVETPATMVLRYAGEDSYRVHLLHSDITSIGGESTNPVVDTDFPHVHGKAAETTLTTEQLRSRIADHHGLVVLDGAYYWPDQAIHRIG